MNVLPTTTVLAVDRQDGRLFLTIDDPATRNALSAALLTDLEAVLEAVRDDRSIGAIVLRGSEGLFCAGGNLKGSLGASAPEGSPDPVRLENERGGRLFHALNAQSQVVIALVDGPAMGGGVGLACCADIVISTARARFALSETRLGLVPAQIAPFVAARIGTVPTRRLALTGAVIEGADAQRLGLSDVHCVDEGEAAAVLEALLVSIERCGPRANAVTKGLIAAIAPFDRDRWIAGAADAFTESLRGPEAQEGISAFLERRTPCWAKGRE